MEEGDVDTRRLLVRDVAVGAAGGAVAGGVLALVVALAGFPEWGLVAWGVVTVFALILPPLAAAMRGLAHGLHRYTEQRVPPERRTPTPAAQLTVLGPGNVAAAAAVTAYLVLLVVFALGDGRGSPF